MTNRTWWIAGVVGVVVIAAVGAFVLLGQGSSPAAAPAVSSPPPSAAPQPGPDVAAPRVPADEPVGADGWVGKVVKPELFGIHDTDAATAPAFPVRSTRFWDNGTTWNRIETSPGVFDWTAMDARLAEAAGTEIVYVLGGTPAWVSATPDPADAPWVGPGSAAVPPDDVWERYVREVVTRYKGRIDAYQVWNEPTIRAFWRGTMTELAHLTEVAQRVVHEVDPEALVVAAPIVPRQPGWRRPAVEYLEALKAAGWPVDAFAVHGYPSDAGGPESRVTNVQKMQKLLAEVGAPPRPLWETEINFATGPGGKGRLPEDLQVAYIARNYLDSIRLGLARSHWYAWGTIPDHLRIDVTNPKVAQAYATVESWVAGTTFRGCATTAVSNVPVTDCTFAGESGDIHVLWADQPVSVPTTAATATTLAGTTQPTGGAVEVGPAPVRLG